MIVLVFLSLSLRHHSFDFKGIDSVLLLIELQCKSAAMPLICTALHDYL